MVVHPPTDAELNQLFRALADTTRRDILRRTARQGLPIRALATTYSMSTAAVQKHVAVLAAAGLVSKTPQGRQRLIRAEPLAIARARACLDRLEELWRHRMSGLDALLAEDPSLSPSPHAAERTLSED